MRTSIILWSTASGVILGILVDALLVGAAVLLKGTLADRSFPRWATVAAIAVLAVIPLAAAVLGYLEGRLKTV